VPDAPSIALLALAPNALAFALFGVVALALIILLVLLASREGASAYDQIGRSGISREGDHAGTSVAATAPDSPQARAERELEIRQMLVARSERLVRRGRPALDIDIELALLLEQEQEGGRPSNPHDAGLVAEVHQLVLARNERRARQGLEPLDVDSEVKRTLEELQP
jgi:hypothetical protein